MPQVRLRPLADADILESWDYIAEDSVAAADRWIDRLDEIQAARNPTHGWAGLAMS